MRMNYWRTWALDGFRVSVEYAKVEDADESFCCFIKPGIPKIQRYSSLVLLELKGRELFVRVDEYISGYIQPEGEFCNTDKLIQDTLAKDTVKTVGVNAKYLRDALDSAKNVDGLREVIAIDVRQETEPLVIRSVGRDDIPENIKLVLPVRVRRR